MQDLVKSFRMMGLSESEAIDAARGRDRIQPDLVEARQAARGRGSAYGRSVDDNVDKSTPTSIKTVRRPLTEGGDQRLRGGHSVDVKERVNLPVNLREKGRIVR